MIWDGERGYRVAPPDEVAASEPAGQAAFLSSSAEADAHGTPAFTARPISTRRVLRSAGALPFVGRPPVHRLRLCRPRGRLLCSDRTSPTARSARRRGARAGPVRPAPCRTIGIARAVCIGGRRSRGCLCPIGAVWRRPARLLLGHRWSHPSTGRRAAAARPTREPTPTSAGARSLTRATARCACWPLVDRGHGKRSGE
jgi:hypothetical protein